MNKKELVSLTKMLKCIDIMQKANGSFKNVSRNDFLTVIDFLKTSCYEVEGERKYHDALKKWTNEYKKRYGC